MPVVQQQAQVAPLSQVQDSPEVQVVLDRVSPQEKVVEGVVDLRVFVVQEERVVLAEVVLPHRVVVEVVETVEVLMVLRVVQMVAQVAQEVVEGQVRRV